MSNQIEIEAFCRAKEVAIMQGEGRAGGGETFSTITEYACALGYPTLPDFIQEITGKRVLDLGSGLGGLSKSACHQQINCEIVSLNPRLALGDFKRREKSATETYVKQAVSETPTLTRLLWRLRGISETDFISKVQRFHDERAAAGFAYALPFEKESFDLIFDKDAVSRYASRWSEDYIEPTLEEKQLFQRAIEEMVRVLKPGGKIRIADIFGYGYDKAWKQKILDELGLDYTILCLWGDKQALGVEIIKSHSAGVSS